MTLKELVVGFGTQVRSLWMIGLHAFHKRETLMYPEEPVYLPPRYRGRIVLTRDQTAKSVVSPVTCVRLPARLAVSHYRKQNRKMAAGIRSSSVSTSPAAFSVVCVKKLAQQPLSS